MAASASRIFAFTSGETLLSGTMLKTASTVLPFTSLTMGLWSIFGSMAFMASQAALFSSSSDML